MFAARAGGVAHKSGCTFLHVNEGGEGDDGGEGQEGMNDFIAVIARYMGRTFARGTGWWAVWGPGCLVTAAWRKDREQYAVAAAMP